MAARKHRLKNPIKFTVVILFTIVILIFALDQLVTLIYPLRYQEQIVLSAEKYSLDPYLVLAVIKVESDYDPLAVSSKNAMGLMQITEKTGKWGAQKLGLSDFTKDSLFAPDVNIKIGCWYMSTLFQQFNDTDLVLAAYNGGSGNVTQWLNDKTLSSDGKTLDRIPYKETDNFLKKVKNSRKIYRILYGDISK